MWKYLVCSIFATTALAIWPLPVSYTNGSETLWIDRNVRISYNGGDESSDNTWTSKIVNNSIQRTYDTLFNKNFVPWKFHQRNSDFEPQLTSDATYITSIVLQQNGSDPDNVMKPDVGDVDESYTLSMSSSGEVVITALSSIGLSYGLTTFTQLFFKHTRAACAYTTLAPVEISDKPMFGWRGMNVDTARTFKPMADLYATIDAMAYNKMNRFHWHITDSQAWPLVIPSMPELADQGAYASFQQYSAADVQALQEYGALVGVEVVMEIDQPGHTAAIGYAYPDLIAAFNYQPWGYFAAETPAGTFKLNSTEVPAFLEKMFNDLLPRLAPLTSYFHLGGDEVNANASTQDETVRSNKTEVLQPLIQKFMDRNQHQLAAADFTPLVWEEMLLDWNLTLPLNTIVQTWISEQSVLKVVQQGYRALVGASSTWYLDCGHGDWVDHYQGADARQAYPYTDWCGPVHNWRQMYAYDPLEGIPDHLAHLVIGGETHIWSEQTDAMNMDTMLWPRTCAASEVLWSGAKDEQGRNRSQVLASPRLNEMRERLVARGIRAEPVQMPLCTMNGTQCVV
ncbi:Glucosamine-6-phosphate isomerase (Glucosamine-6-phosphate deaminase) (GNPDA) (GlcN6P deaminase) [Saxophila tyrrhenica]|uniref:Beta-hexosaminidase n=1 Tax=Saxophila tyrrhenica TaxID=1690608 RepID=A0AAV9P7B9_9PEZI|nr:Glucosamine-6-phosphate isomerase (Glucosamine-6-phosphate deaminase) (GNPDA) (GlcN6P deaminase) [Saxophila tyrrhenica]